MRLISFLSSNLSRKSIDLKNSYINKDCYITSRPSFRTSRDCRETRWISKILGSLRITWKYLHVFPLLNVVAIQIDSYSSVVRSSLIHRLSPSFCCHLSLILFFFFSNYINSDESVDLFIFIELSDR